MQRALLFIVVCLLAACGGTETSVVSPVSMPAVAGSSLTNDPNFDGALRKWVDAGIMDYDFTATHIGGGPTDGVAASVLVKVRGGQFDSITSIEKERTHGMNRYLPFNTVDKMFAYIRAGSNDKYPPRVRYNAKYGYPEQISTTYDFALTDSWSVLKVDSFSVVTTP